MVQCIICKRNNIDDIKYGKLITKNKISVHYFCLLLASNLVQNGNDDEGILGFLLIDIQREAKRISRQICCYCGMESAAIGCCDRKCRRIFHLNCGIENGALNQFSETFRSFCDLHIPNLLLDKLPLNAICSICCDTINEKYVYTMCCKAPCCKNGWFHKYCLQEFAFNSGYFFKCPLCNNKDQFRDILVNKGIFVPDQDASWELEPNAFSDLLERPNQCSALKCLCRKGREYINATDYEIIFCVTCGSQGIHVICNADNRNEFNCIECSTILSERNKNQNSSYNINAACSNTDFLHNYDENEFVDVDDIEEDSKEITAAQAFRNSINNHPLATDYEDFEKIINNITNIKKSNAEMINVEKTEDFILKSNISQQPEHRSISNSEDDEIIQLTNRKKRKINSDSNLPYRNKNITRSTSISESSDNINLVMNKRYHGMLALSNSTESSQSSPIFQSRIRRGLKNTIDSSDDTVPLTFFTNKNSIENHSTLNKDKEPLVSPKKPSSSQKNINRTNTTDSSVSPSILLQRKRGRKCKKLAIDLSDDTDLNQNGNTSNRQNYVIKTKNNISNQNLKIEENKPIKLKYRKRAREADDITAVKKRYFTRSSSQSIASSMDGISSTISIEKSSPSAQNRVFASKKFSFDRFQRENSQSSLSSGDINLKEKNKSILEDNAKNKQTPINRNIPSSSRTRLKSRFISIKSYNNSLKSSGTSSIFPKCTKSTINPDIKTTKLRRRSVSISPVNSIENNSIHCQSSTIPIKNDTIYPNYINSDLISTENNATQPKTSSHSSSSNLLFQRLQIDNDSDSDDFVSTIIEKMHNNKENARYKKKINKNKKCLNITTTRNDAKLRKSLRREYIEIISITIEEEERN